MGFFSWDCKGCSHSIREGGREDWMAVATVLDSEGQRIIGEYDGYGRIGGGGTSIQDLDLPEVWHRACYKAAGKPAYTGPSRSAADQGCHDVVLMEPKTSEHLFALWEIKQTSLRDLRERTKTVWTKAVAEMHEKGEPVPDYALRLATTGDS